jgi:hypothetical protein
MPMWKLSFLGQWTTVMANELFRNTEKLQFPDHVGLCYACGVFVGVLTDVCARGNNQPPT